MVHANRLFAYLFKHINLQIQISSMPQTQLVMDRPKKRHESNPEAPHRPVELYRGEGKSETGAVTNTVGGRV